MAASTLGRIVLLSIHPEYASLIMERKKTVEFRRRALPPDVSHAIVYATSPVKRLVGTFEIDGIVEDSPFSLWERFRSVGGISRRRFREYFVGRKKGYAIQVRRPRPLPADTPITCLDEKLSPPQSFAYVPRPSFERLSSRRHGR